MNHREYRNAVLSVTAESLVGFANCLVAPATVLTILLLKYGAGGVMIGSIYGIESAGSLLPQLLGMCLFVSLKKRKFQLMLWTLLVIVPFMFLMAILARFAEELSPSLFRWGILAGLIGYTAAWGIVTAVWSDWFAHIFHQNIRGTVTGFIWGVSALAGAIGTVIAGRLIKLSDSPAMYSNLYLATGMLLILSWGILYRIDDSGANATAETPQLAAMTLFLRFKESLLDRNFRNFLIARLLATAGFCITPFIAVYYTSAEGGKIDGGTVVSYSAVMSLGMASANIFLGRLGDRCGHRMGLLASTAVQIPTLLVMLLIPGRIGCLLAYTGAGICLGSGLVSHYNMLFETCPHESRVAHITIGNLGIGAGAILISLVAGAIAAQWGLRSLFTICLALSVVALFWLACRVQEPRQLRLCVSTECG